MKNYIEQAVQFLADTATGLEIEKAVPQKKPIWAKEGEKHGINYSVTLSNKNGKYSFDFWGSINDAEMLEMAKKSTIGPPEREKVLKFIRNKADNIIPIHPVPKEIFMKRISDTVDLLIKPTSYDILACLDVLYSDSFDDFCAEFGYSNDSIKAEKTYKACLKQDRMLRKLFTPDQLEKLQAIN